MYSRNYSYNSLDTSSARDVAQSFANAKNAADGTKQSFGGAAIPVKSFPDIGAYTHFEKDVGNGSLTPKDTRTPARPQAPSAAETAASPLTAPPKSEEPAEKAEESVALEVSAKAEESDADEKPEVEETSDAALPASKTDGKNAGLAVRLKHGLAKYTGGLTSSIGIDDILLAALLILFLTDGSEENDSLIPIILLALILF